MGAVLLTTRNKMRKQSKKDSLIIFKPNAVWKVYVDPNAEAIQPKWWHKLFFWKKWNYAQWKMKRDYIKLKDLLDA